MRKSLIPAIISMLGMSGFSGVATDTGNIQVTGKNIERTVTGKWIEPTKSERTSKAASNRWRSPSWFKFPRSRKTVTAAFLKRAAKKRNNINARSKK